MSLEADEDEHSIEMHLPYVAKVRHLGGQNSTTYTLGSISHNNMVILIVYIEFVLKCTIPAKVASPEASLVLFL